MIAVLGGCSTSPKPLTYLGHSDLQYYKGLATKVDYPSRPDPDNPAAFASREPRRIRHPQKDDIWDLSLSDAVHIALKNNKIIRAREQLLLPRNPLVGNPDQIPSVFDPALQETGVLFGQRGVEAALSDFDAQLSSSMTWGHSEQAENNAGLSGVPKINGIPTLIEDTGTFKTRLDKTFADSGQISLIQEWDYVQNNVTGNLFPSVYTGFVRAEYRRPLLAGAGADYTRVAGPISKNTPGVSQGVVIARINNDIALADFESSVHTLIRDVQHLYWDLSLAYHTYHEERTNRENALNTWRLIDNKTKRGLEGGSSADDSQALENYYDGQGRAQDALANIYIVEEQLRRLLGLPVNDGRVIRPCDDLTVAEFVPDWHIALAEGIARRPEIRKQKWNIKSLQLQLEAAKSQTRPRLDFVAGGQINAFGDQLIGSQSQLAQPGSSAFASVAEAQQTSWNIGLEAAIAIGYRAAHTAVRNQELRLARARAGLATQELDVSHEIAEAFQTLDRSYTAAQSAFNRRTAAAERVEAYKAQYELKGATVDPLLRAQQSLVLAEVAYYQSVAQYNQAITDFYYRTGTILEESNVSIAEDMWDPHAYSDALREAWARSHGAPNPLLRTAPAEFVVPPGRPTAAVPLIAPTCPPANSPQLQTERSMPASPSPSPQAPPQPSSRPRNESEPAAPLPALPGGPAGMPEAQAANPPDLRSILPVAAGVENVSSPVTTAAGQFETFLAPVPVIPGANPSNAAQNVLPVMGRAAAVVTPQSPVDFLSPATLSPPALQPPAASWSVPQAGPSVPRAGSSNSIDDVRSPSTDQYDMPLNQLGQ